MKPNRQNAFWIESPRADGTWNMAADRMMMECAANTGNLFFRLYTWSRPTLTLGYFQAADDRVRHPSSIDCPWVRRPTGGGAILHHREWTYALAIPKQHPFARGRKDLYCTLHRSLVQSLKEVLGIQSQLYDADQCAAPQPSPRRRPTSQPFLCFQRRSSGDIVSGEKKIVGSAQYRTSRAVLQHGSILWSGSPHAPELPGIEELLGVSLTDEHLLQWRNGWRAMLAELWSVDWRDRQFSPPERRRIQEYEKTIFRHDSWNHRR